MRVAIADDSALFREALAALLSAGGVEVVVQAKSGDELLTRIPGHRIDAAILDIRMPPTFTDEGLSTAEALRSADPTIAVLVLSTYAETAYAMRLLSPRAAGLGYLLKDRVDSSAALVDALSRLRSGETVVDPDLVSRLLNRPRRNPLHSLTDRERRVLALMAEGRSTISISNLLQLSPKTIETHVASIFTKLDLPSSGETNRRVLAVLTWLRSNQ